MRAAAVCRSDAEDRRDASYVRVGAFQICSLIFSQSYRAILV